MGFFDYLNRRQQMKELENAQRKTYMDIAHLLWYDVAFNILPARTDDLVAQNTPFLIYCWGNNTVRFGPILALDKNEDIVRFKRRAQILLRDKNYGSFRVGVFPDAILLTKI